jgi:imidazolonepropionase-like amidohydrolase
VKKALIAGTLSAAALLALGSASRDPRKAAASSLAFAITHAHVVPMDTERVLRDHTIVVVGDRIAAVGPDGPTNWPAGATVVDARGAYVAPGLVDMHVHIRRRELRAYVNAGITSVRNMWGYQALPATMRDIENRAVVGPTIYSASQGIDASPGVWPETQFVDEPSQAEAVVAAQAAAGWRFLKVYDSLSAASYDAIVDAARSHGIRFVGHVPDSVSIEHALDSGQLSIEHLRGYDHALTRTSQGSHVAAWADIDASRIPELAARTASADAWNCPTMAIYDLLAAGMAPPVRARIFANRAAVLRAFRDAGARILAGSDAGIDRTAAGTSLHDEISLLAAAGLSPYEVLEAATSGAAEFLGEQAEIGTIQPGRRADLVLMDANPLENVEALRAIRAVVLRGSWHSLDGARTPLVPRAPANTSSPRAVTRPAA